MTLRLDWRTERGKQRSGFELSHSRKFGSKSAEDFVRLQEKKPKAIVIPIYKYNNNNDR